MDSENYLCFYLCLLNLHAYVNVLHWIIKFYYYGFLVNEDKGLILVIQNILSIFY